MVYGINPQEDEFIVDSLLAIKGDVSNYFRLNEISIENVLGEEVTTRKYSSYWISSYDYYNWNISKNFCLINAVYADAVSLEKRKYELIYAKINGVEYGTLVDVKTENETIPSKFILSQSILEALSGVEIIYTYNGSRFDLAFIHCRLGLNLTKHFTHHDLYP